MENGGSFLLVAELQAGRFVASQMIFFSFPFVGAEDDPLTPDFLIFSGNPLPPACCERVGC